MILTTIRGRRWPNRRARLAAGVAMAGLSAYHCHRQGLYAWAVVGFTLGSTTFVLRALRPLGPLWALSEEDPGTPPPAWPHVPVGATRRVW